MASTKEQGRHTKLPWTSVHGDSVLFIRARGKRIASVGSVPYWERYSGECEANAEFIVTACNNHYALLEALEEAHKVLAMMIDPVNKGSGTAIISAYAMCTEAEAKARAAISAARGKS